MEDLLVTHRGTIDMSFTRLDHPTVDSDVPAQLWLSLELGRAKGCWYLFCEKCLLAEAQEMKCR
jgi:hypothetical protein